MRESQKSLPDQIVFRQRRKFMITPMSRKVCHSDIFREKSARMERAGLFFYENLLTEKTIDRYRDF